MRLGDAYVVKLSHSTKVETLSTSCLPIYGTTVTINKSSNARGHFLANSVGSSLATKHHTHRPTNTSNNNKSLLT